MLGVRKMEVSEDGFDKIIGGGREIDGVWGGKINDRRDAEKLNKNKYICGKRLFLDNCKVLACLKTRLKILPL